MGHSRGDQSKMQIGLNFFAQLDKRSSPSVCLVRVKLSFRPAKEWVRNHLKKAKIEIFVLQKIARFGKISPPFGDILVFGNFLGFTKLVKC